MENKKSFLLYTDLIHTVEKLPNDKAGELFKHVLRYVNDEHPETDDLIIQVAFEPIRQSLKRDLEKWKGISERNRKNGNKGGRPKKTQKTQPLLKEPKKADNVSVSDKDNEISIINNSKFEQFCRLLHGRYNEIFNRNTRVFSDKIKSKYKARLKEGYNLTMIDIAMQQAARDEYHKTTNPPYKHLTLEFFSRPEKIDKFYRDIENNKTTKYIPTK